MATEIAPAPPGVQSFEKPLGPQSAKGEHANKFRKAFAELTAADVKPKETDETNNDTGTIDAGSSEKQPVVQPGKTETAEKPVVQDSGKPESPLDAVLSKTAPKEEKVEEPDVLKEFDEKTANWQRAREVMKTQSSELKALREEITKAKAAPKVEPSVIEELTKQRDELASRYQQQEERLKAISYRYSDEYQQIVTDRDNVLGKISSRVKSYGGDANAILEALQLPEGKIRAAQIKEAMSEMDPDDKPRIHALIEQFETHQERLSDAEKNAAPKWDELRSKRDLELAEQSQAAIKQLETEFGKVAEILPSNTATLREVPDDVPGAAEWNQEIRTARENALRVLKPNGADFNESVSVAMKGARYDSLEKRYLDLHSDYTELKQKYNEAVGSGPDFKGGSKPTTEGPKKPGVKYREALAIARSQSGEM